MIGGTTYACIWFLHFIETSSNAKMMPCNMPMMIKDVSTCKIKITMNIINTIALSVFCQAVPEVNYSMDEGPVD